MGFLKSGLSGLRRATNNLTPSFVKRWRLARKFEELGRRHETEARRLERSTMESLNSAPVTERPIRADEAGQSLGQVNTLLGKAAVARARAHRLSGKGKVSVGGTTGRQK